MGRVPIYLAFAFGGIALATAPAPALSIVQEFQTSGPVTDTLIPMAVLDDIIGIIVFFTVNSFIARAVSGGSVSLAMIPVMIFLPILIGAVVGFIVGKIRWRKIWCKNYQNAGDCTEISWVDPASTFRGFLGFHRNC